MTNGDKIKTLDDYRRERAARRVAAEPSWMQEREDQPFNARIAACCVGAGLVLLAGVIGLSIWQHAQTDDHEAEVISKQIVIRCLDRGWMPKVDRDRKGKLLATRCSPP